MFNTQDILLAILQSQYEAAHERIDYRKPAPEPHPDANPFQDNGLPLYERFATQKEEIEVKVNFLGKIRN